jgi:Ca2+-binding EF-hand superfamily protein
MKSLGWTLVLLLLMIYIVGVYFTQSISEHMVDRANDGLELNIGDHTLRDYFGSLSRTILTLYQTIVGGVDWDTLAQPMIEQIGWIHGLALAGYIAFAILALMNVVTGVFVQTALQSAKNEEDEFLTEQVIGIFKATDVDQSLSLSLQEVTDALNDPSSASFFSSIDLCPQDAIELFSILDIDDSGEVCFEEFLQGCLRLKGPAKSKDMLEVMQEQRRGMIATSSFHERVEQCLPHMRRIGDIEAAVSRLTFKLESVLDSTQDEERSIRSIHRTLQELERDQREIVHGLRVVVSGDVLGASMATSSFDMGCASEASEGSAQSKLLLQTKTAFDAGELV